MKKVIAIAVMVVSFVFAGYAQQTNDEVYVGASYLKQNVETLDSNTFVLDKSKDSVGVLGDYTHYFGGDKKAGKVGVVGITMELSAQFHDYNNSTVALVTGGYGVTVKARNQKFQPFVKIIGGFARSNFGGTVFRNGTGFTRSAGGTTMLVAGAGFDLMKSKTSRVKWRLGADYMNTGFGETRQHNVRIHSGIVF